MILKWNKPHLIITFLNKLTSIIELNFKQTKNDIMDSGF